MGRTENTRVGSVWTRPRPPAPEAPVTREKIVNAAVALLDEEGLSGLTMRRLAQRLDSASTTMYWHVETKDDVLDLALDAVFGDVVLPPSTPNGPGWRATVTAVCTAVHTALLRHPWSTGLIGARPLLGPNALACAEFLHATLVSGLEVSQAVSAGHALSNYVVGAAATQVGWHARLDTDPHRSVRAFLAARAEDCPVLARCADEPERRWRDGFDHGLRALLDGLTGFEEPRRALRLPSGGLRDERIVVRHLADRDAEDYARGSADERVRRFAHLPVAEYTPELVREQLAGVIADGIADGTLAVLAIADVDSDRFLGSIVVFDTDPATASAEVGFWLAPHGRGVAAARRAVTLVAAWGRAEHGWQLVRAHTETANIASQHVLTGAGFVPATAPVSHTTPSGAEVTGIRYERRWDPAV